MFSAKIKSRLVSVGLASALLSGLGAGAAMAAPAVVVKSTVDKYPVGSQVDDADTITLGSGDSVTVLTQKGTRTMKGPGSFKVGAKPKSNRGRFANLTRKRAATKGTTGAIRGPEEAEAEGRPLNPNLYYVDVERSATMCLYDLEEVRLWRPYNGGITTYRLSAGSAQGTVDVTFDDGASEAPIDPALMTVSEGVSYTVTGPDLAEPVSLSFVDLGQVYRRADELAIVLLEKGCDIQFELLAEKMGA